MSAVAMMSRDQDASADTMERLRALAATKRHVLASWQIDGTRPLSEAAAAAMMIYLGKCSDLPVGAAPAPVRRAAEAPAAAFERPQPESRLRQPGPAASRRGRPGSPVTEEGIYYYRDRIYRVYRSQYDGAMRAKVLTIVPKGVRPEWVAATRILGILRDSDKMTDEQSRRYEELYDYAPCKHCGLSLENDESRARRSGPKCFAKHGT